MTFKGGRSPSTLCGMTAFALDVSADRLTLRITRGAGFRHPVSVTLRPSGLPMNITAADVYAFVKLVPDGNVVMQLEAHDIPGYGVGVFELRATAGDTLLLEAGSYWWEMGYRNKDNEPQSLVEGVMEVMNRGRNP